jgi:hypothetical protein
LTTLSPPSTRPSGSRGRRSSAFARKDSGTPRRSAVPRLAFDDSDRSWASAGAAARTSIRRASPGQYYERGFPVLSAGPTPRTPLEEWTFSIQGAIWLSRGGALVTLLHRRADLRETMSDYLIGDLERHGVAVRDRSEITALHGTDGQLEAVTLRDGERVPLSYLFLFLGASPCTDWIGSTVLRDEHGCGLTGADAGAGEALETSVPGVYAAGDARSGSL